MLLEIYLSIPFLFILWCVKLKEGPTQYLRNWWREVTAWNTFVQLHLQANLSRKMLHFFFLKKKKKRLTLGEKCCIFFFLKKKTNKQTNKEVCQNVVDFVLLYEEFECPWFSLAVRICPYCHLHWIALLLGQVFQSWVKIAQC